MALLARIEILLMLLLVTGQMHAQSTSTKRDINSAGPFPIYMTYQGTASIGYDDFESLSSYYASMNNNTNNKKILWGVEATIGFALNEKRPRYFKNIFIEPFSFRNMQRTVDGQNESLTYYQQSMSFRVGKRINIFFPLTLHPQIGLIYFRQIITRLDNEIDPQNLSFRSSDYTYLLRDGKIPGIDYKLRLIGFDPIGSSGGAGIYIEYFGAFLFDSEDLKIGSLGGGIKPEIESDTHISGLSLGIIIPLALRVKEFPLRFRRWKNKSIDLREYRN